MDRNIATTGGSHPSAGTRFLRIFSCLICGYTLLVIAVGGLVTSKGAGLAVPDWPTTYGYNMFLFPISHWVGGIFYEHTHRLAASLLGLFTLMLCAWIWLVHRHSPLRWWALAAVMMVSAQGILGGLRVVLLKDHLGIIHAATAQLFLGLMLLIALQILLNGRPIEPAWSQLKRSTGLLIILVTGLIFMQLLIGASMRHQHAGLAIPDFPLAYGQLWPDTSPEFVQQINRQRIELNAAKPITAGQIHLQMLHRIIALIITGGIFWVYWRVGRESGFKSSPARLGLVWTLGVLLQAGLGAATIWSNKAADMATLHVVVGAIVFMTGLALYGSHILALRRLSSVPSASSSSGPGILRSAMETVTCLNYQPR